MNMVPDIKKASFTQKLSVGGVDLKSGMVPQLPYGQQGLSGDDDDVTGLFQALIV